MGSGNSKKIQNTNKSGKKQLHVLPMKMANVKTMMDPWNHKNYFIFESLNNQCWYFNDEKQTLDRIIDIPKCQTQNGVCGHSCAIFETFNDASNRYALIYGGNDKSATYNIYEIKTKQWNAIATQLNYKWFKNKNIMHDAFSEYSFGQGLSMITDLFAKNKIHIIGGALSHEKYGCFEFNQQILNNPNLSFVWLHCKKEKTTKKTIV